MTETKKIDKDVEKPTATFSGLVEVIKKNMDVVTGRVDPGGELPGVAIFHGFLDDDEYMLTLTPVKLVPSEK